MARLNLGNIFAVLLVIGATACSKSTEPASSGTNATQAASSAKPALPPIDLKGPILSLVMASSIDDKGRPVNPRFTFAPDERQLTVIVSVGKVTGSMLDMVWYKTSDDGDQKLFEYHVDVHSYDRAYSIGKNPRTLAAGNYKITATLEGYKREVAFDVASPKGQPKLTGHRQTAQGRPPASGGSGTVPQPMAKSAAAATGASPAKKPLDLSKCEMDLETLGNVAPAVAVMAATMCPHEGVLYFNGPATVEGTIEGPARPIAVDDEALVRINPCALSGASDLPGAKIQVTATGQIGDPRPVKKLEITLGDDTLSPRLEVHSTPPKDSKVKAGDKIAITARAIEARSGGPWQTGVRSVQLVATPGGSIGEGWTNPSKRALPCEEKTWSHEYTATYTVPDNPPGTIEICALASDFATDYSNKENTKCAKFFTGDVWKGTLHAKSSQFWAYPDSSAQCINEEWDIDLVLIVAGDGSVTGNGAGHLVSMPKCSARPFPLTDTWQKGLALQGHTISCPDIRGRFDGKGFQLQFPVAYPGEQHGTLGGILSLSGEPPGQNPPTLRAQVIGQGMARGQTETDVIIGDAHRHGKGVFDITLKCTTCK